MFRSGSLRSWTDDVNGGRAASEGIGLGEANRWVISRVQTSGSSGSVEEAGDGGSPPPPLLAYSRFRRAPVGEET